MVMQQTLIFPETQIILWNEVVGFYSSFIFDSNQKLQQTDAKETATQKISRKFELGSGVRVYIHLWKFTLSFSGALNVILRRKGFTIG